jgi:hypothetical protein
MLYIYYIYIFLKIWIYYGIYLESMCKLLFFDQKSFNDLKIHYDFIFFLKLVHNFKYDFQ